MKKNRTLAGHITITITVIMAILCALIAGIGFYTSAKTPSDWGALHFILSLITVFLGMARVAQYHLRDGLDNIMAAAVNGLWGLGMSLGLLGSTVAVQSLPEMYDIGAGAICIVLGFSAALFAPLLYTRLRSTGSIIIDDDTSENTGRSTSAWLSIILLANVAISIVFQIVMWLIYS